LGGLHPVATIWIAAFCLWVSIAFIIRLWFVHRTTSTLKKLMWSFILLIPLFGWLAYGGCFTRSIASTRHARASTIGGRILEVVAATMQEGTIESAFDVRPFRRSRNAQALQRAAPSCHACCSPESLPRSSDARPPLEEGIAPIG
jgi:hypothetical protein